MDYGGTLTVTNLAGTLNAGDTFTVVSAGSSSGSFSFLQGTAGAGKAWSFTNGVLRVIATVNLTPTNLIASVTGNTLVLSWPADYLGWRLQKQTNSAGTGLGTNWTDVAKTSGTNVYTGMIDPTEDSVFYRLVYP